MKPTTNETQKEKKGGEAVELTKQPPPTTYAETLMHLFKGNVGPGCFASEFIDGSFDFC
jgi:hypothetical protein